MALRYFANGSATTLVSSITNSDVSLSVVSVAQFPTQFPYTLILDPDTSSEEVVEVTAAVGTTLTVTRGVDTTTAFSHSAGAAIHHGISARDIRESNTHVNATENIHGGTGNPVDTGSTQTITGTKTFTTLKTSAGGDVVALAGAQTITGAKAFTGANTHSGTETFTGDVSLPATVNVPRGIVSKAESTADSVLSAGANSRVAVLGAGFALKAGRRYRIKAKVEAVPTSAGFNRMHIHNITTATDWAFAQDGVVKSASVADILETETPPYDATVDVTYTFQAQILSTAGTIKMLHDATNKSFIYIEDLGEY